MQGPPCIALLSDLDGDGEDEVIVPLRGDGTVYARQPDRWVNVGRLMPGYSTTDDQLRASLRTDGARPLTPSKYHGLEIAGTGLAFLPCAAGDTDCVPVGR